MNGMKWMVILLAAALAGGCASASKNKKPVIFETAPVTQAYETIGPVSVREELNETPQDMAGGIAEYIAKDGRVSEHIPADMKAALESKGQKYKEMIFEKLSSKAQESGADAVIGVKYRYIPPFVSFTPKAVVTAEGTMVKYK